MAEAGSEHVLKLRLAFEAERVVGERREEERAEERRVRVVQRVLEGEEGDEDAEGSGGSGGGRAHVGGEGVDRL